MRQLDDIIASDIEAINHINRFNKEVIINT